MVTVMMVVVEVIVGVVNNSLLGSHFNQHNDRDGFDIEDNNYHDQHKIDSNAHGSGPSFTCSRSNALGAMNS
jgi:hypothetical protein